MSAYEIVTAFLADNDIAFEEAGPGMVVASLPGLQIGRAHV